MPAFKYTAFRPDGKEESGIIESETLSSARRTLMDRQLYPSDIHSALARSWKDSLYELFDARRVTQQELAVFTKQLSVMLRSGISIKDAISYIASNGSSVSAGLCYQLQNSLLEGLQFSDAMERALPAGSNQFVVESIRSGERSGSLDRVLDNISIHLSAGLKARRAVLGALIYPAILVSVSVCVVLFLMINVIPEFESIFKDAGKELPALTRAVMSSTDFLKRYGLVVVGAILLFVLVSRRLLRRRSIRKVVHNWMLKAPVFGDLLRDVLSMHIVKNLDIMCSSGVSLHHALIQAENLSRNEVITQAMADIVADIEQGNRFSTSLEKHACFSPLFKQLVSSGESSGQLDAMFGQTAELLEEQNQAKMQVLSAVIEPLALIFVAGLVFVLVMSVLLPVFDMNSII